MAAGLPPLYRQQGGRLLFFLRGMLGASARAEERLVELFCARPVDAEQLWSSACSDWASVQPQRPPEEGPDPVSERYFLALLPLTPLGRATALLSLSHGGSEADLADLLDVEDEDLEAALQVARTRLGEEELEWRSGARLPLHPGLDRALRLALRAPPRTLPGRRRPRAASAGAVSLGLMLTLGSLRGLVELFPSEVDRQLRRQEQEEQRADLDNIEEGPIRLTALRAGPFPSRLQGRVQLAPGEAIVPRVTLDESGYVQLFEVIDERLRRVWPVTGPAQELDEGVHELSVGGDPFTVEFSQPGERVLLAIWAQRPPAEWIDPELPLEQGLEYFQLGWWNEPSATGKLGIRVSDPFGP